MKKNMNLAQLSELSEEEAREFLEEIRWSNGVTCVHCNSKEVVKLKGKSTRAGVYKCRNCRKQFTVTLGTIFEGSHIPIGKWLMAFHLICSSKKGISALQLQRNLGLTYKSAWHMAHRIRYAMKQEPLSTMLKGQVEVDETYIGGKKKGKRGRGSTNKTPVVALVQRNGDVRTKVVKRVSAKELKSAIRENVHKDSIIYTDEWPSYRGIGKEFKGGHKVVNHGIKEYVKDDAYTNTAEAYFSLLKRGVNGIFHHVSKRHLHRYCSEFDFRWNTRKIDDGERTVEAIKCVEGKRLTYKEPIKTLSSVLK